MLFLSFFYDYKSSLEIKQTNNKESIEYIAKNSVERIERRKKVGKIKEITILSFLNYPVNAYTNKFVPRESYYKILARPLPFKFPALASSVSR